MSEIKIGGESRGKVIYNEGIVNGIVTFAIINVDGVAVKENNKSDFVLADNIKLSKSDGKINVDVGVSVIYGFNIPDIAFNIQHGIRQSVESMTNFKIGKVNVSVNDVVFINND